MTAELSDASATELLDLFCRGEASPVEALDSCLRRIEELNPALNAVLTVCSRTAKAQAEESAARWRAGNARPLDGVPFGLKDLVMTSGHLTTGGSLIYKQFVPTADATVVERLAAAGAVLAAKCQTFEFGYGYEQFGATRNPWNVGRTPGASSSGSAAAVAARLLPVTIGSDTGGSIRCPSSFCGVTGLKPTFGRVPLTGFMPSTYTMDHIGPIARSAVDAALVLDVMSGHDPRDPTSAALPASRIHRNLTEGSADLRGIRVGLPSNWFFDICDPEVQQAITTALNVLQRLGAVVQPVAIRNADMAPSVYLVLLLAEMSAVHRPHGSQLHKMSAPLAERVVLGESITAGDYLDALHARHELQRGVEEALAVADVLVMPTTVGVAHEHFGPDTAFKDAKIRIGNRWEPAVKSLTRTLVVHDVTGIPALSIPVGLNHEGLPMGMQICALPFREDLCLRVAHAYQHVTEHHRLAPDLMARPGGGMG